MNFISVPTIYKAVNSKFLCIKYYVMLLIKVRLFTLNPKLRFFVTTNNFYHGDRVYWQLEDDIGENLRELNAGNMAQDFLHWQNLLPLWFFPLKIKLSFFLICFSFSLFLWSIFRVEYHWVFHSLISLITLITLISISCLQPLAPILDPL